MCILKKASTVSRREVVFNCVADVKHLVVGEIMISIEAFYFFTRRVLLLAPLTKDAIMARATRLFDKGIDLHFRALAFRRLETFSAFVATLLLALIWSLRTCIMI